MDEMINKTSGSQPIRVQNMTQRTNSGPQPSSSQPSNIQQPQRPTHVVPGKKTFGNFGAQSSKIQRGATESRRGAFTSVSTLNILEKLIGVCVFMLFFGLPLFFINLTYQGIGFEKQYYFYLWTFIGVVALIARGMLGGKIEIRRTPLDVPLGIMWIAFVLSAVFSVDKYHSVFGFFGAPINGLISVTALILAYYLVVSYITKQRIMMIWWAIVASGSLVTVWSFLATMRIVPDRILQYITPSLTGSFTGLAILLAMMLPFFVVSFSIIDGDVRSSLRAKVVALLVLAMMLVNILTLSILFGYVRWIVVIGGMGVLLVFVISRMVQVSQKTTSIAIGTFLLLIALYMWGHPVITRTAIQPEALINYSLSFKVAKSAIADKPLFGSGLGTYGYNFSLHKPEELNKTGQYDVRFYSDRGFLMESLSTVGIVGAVALVVVILTYMSTVLHAFVQTRDEEMKIVGLGFFVAAMIALIFTMFWSVDGVIIAYGVLLSAVLMGVLRGSLAEAEDSKYALSMSASPQHALSFAFLSILVAVGVIFGFVTLGKMFVADVYAGSALRARANGDYEKSANLFKNAVVLNGREGRYFTVIGQYGLDLANVELAKEEGQRNTQAVEQYVKSATGSSMIGKNMMPNDVLANETMGFVFENSGGYVPGALESAMSAYNRARELEPNNPYLDIAVGKLKLVEAQAKGQDATEEKTALINEAKTLFEEAKNKTTFDYNGQNISLFAPAHYYLSVVSEALGNTDEAITAMSTALQVTQVAGASSSDQQMSRQINYGFNLARLLQLRGTDEDNKNAERLLLQIIGVNDKEINSLLNLGLLYERTNRKDEAIAEYKKILEILPESDSKAKENVQNLIDTIQQGGSNVDDKQGQNSAATSRETTEETVEMAKVLVVRGGNGDERAEQSKNALQQEGRDVQIRDINDEVEGVSVLYNAKADQSDVKKVENTLRGRIGTVTSKKDDAEVAKYSGYDIVVMVGGEIQDQSSSGETITDNGGEQQ